MINAILPILTIIIMVVVGLFINGRNAILSGDNTALIQQVQDTPFKFDVMINILGKSNASVAMMWASFSGTIVAFILVLSQRILTFKETMEAWIDGAKSLVIAIMVLVLAWGIGSICKDLGTAKYLSAILTDKVSPGIIPMAVFLLSCIIAFSTGTSWGTTAIMMPIAVPILFEISGGDTGLLLYETIGSVFTGAVFGDHCSPISDTTIMSSMSSACDHLDHVKTQMPYALTVAGIALVVGYIPLLFLPSSKVVTIVFPILVLIIGFIAAFFIIKLVGKKVDDAPEVSQEKIEQKA
ncbi:Na+/H+ antiporter NhaC family protein [Oceanirhabdus sp. W0125-5]|uniref:Na+/H+ antiporter NhaC family protein n=1 Tax=Oceanirhabdus sp. W0125-5 TaxID=2999116 RepID=UPI0022F2E7FF|nr:Na+/H+ antiporter NhaC family protein [Oceanirhabdus sp. W0125-5]WBW99036.1 Na+/H+ antiporter NhaC family protein [Oceanirhabdus sp. W0125-5]